MTQHNEFTETEGQDAVEQAKRSIFLTRRSNLEAAVQHLLEEIERLRKEIQKAETKIAEREDIIRKVEAADSDTIEDLIADAERGLDQFYIKPTR